MRKLLLILFMFWCGSAWATNYCNQAQACYLFNEGSGTTTTDSSGNGNTGTLSSVTWSNKFPRFNGSGNPLYSTFFSGSSTNISLGSSDSILLYNQPMTVTFWMYPTASALGYGPLILCKGNGIGTNARVCIQYDTVGNGGTDIQLIVQGSTNFIRDTSLSSNVPLNTWTFIAVTWDGSTTASNAHIYINNAEVSYNGSTNGVSLSSNSGKNIFIGDINGLGTRNFEGNIANMGIFNSVLSSTAITAIYNSGLTGAHTNILNKSIIQGGSIIN